MYAIARSVFHWTPHSTSLTSSMRLFRFGLPRKIAFCLFSTSASSSSSFVCLSVCLSVCIFSIIVDVDVDVLWLLDKIKYYKLLLHVRAYSSPYVLSYHRYHVIREQNERTQKRKGKH